jgi:hypothetical protein
VLPQHHLQRVLTYFPATTAMAALSSSIVDSVKSLGLNGSTEHTNGALNGDIKIRNICCVGAGYVGMYDPFCF